MTQIQATIYQRDQHNISRNDIDPDALKIMYRLIRNGYKAYLVGGAVRDLLLNKIPQDYDIGTDATPRRIKSLFRNSRIIGRRFKLVHVYFRGNKIIEVSTFRDETESALDDQRVSITTDNVYGDESTDARRRDLTINGLFYDISSFSVIDYVGGMADLQDGIVRIIGNPDKRFAEDPVRLLRTIRHSARSGFIIEDCTWQSLCNNRALILKSPAVRVYEELRRDFSSGHLFSFLNLLKKSELLAYLLPVLCADATNFLAEESLFAKIIGKIDEFAGNGKEIPATVVLAFFALALIASDQNLQLSDEEEMSEYIKEIFISIAVPRKERERIVSLVYTVKDIAAVDISKIRVAQFTRKPYFNDLLLIAQIAGDYFFSPEVIEFLTHAFAFSKKDYSRRAANRANRHIHRLRKTNTR